MNKFIFAISLLLSILRLSIGQNYRSAQPIFITQSSRPKHTSRSHSPISNYVEETRPYNFDYGVQDEYSGTSFGHSEASNGKEVTGTYTVALPDGRIQRVTYTADDHNGFVAKVTYEGEAKFPEFQAKKPNFVPQHHRSLSKQPRFEPQQHRSLSKQPRFEPQPHLSQAKVFKARPLYNRRF